MDLSRSRVKPYAHQIVGVERLVRHPFFLLADEMGAGKTKQAIDAAQVLHTQNLVDRVLVLAPSPVRRVWFDPEMGELKKHLWEGIDAKVTEFHARTTTWHWGRPSVKPLEIVVTNYEFLRAKNRLNQIFPICGPRTLLICDESSSIKNHRAMQTKAALQLRRNCGRIWLLNGTPIANNPLDMFSQGNIMHPDILRCSSFIHFRARYGIMGGFQGRVVIGWQNLEDLQRRFAPYVLRRLKADCLDLPPKLPYVTFSVPLSDETWAIYKEMRDEMIAWLDNQTVSVAAQAIVKAIRLSQVTSGFLGGIQEQAVEDVFEEDDRPPWVGPPQGQAPSPKPAVQQLPGGQETLPLMGNPCPENLLPSNKVSSNSLTNIREIGTEKLDFFLSWLDDRLAEDPCFKLIVWCRFRAEVERLNKAVAGRPIQVGLLWGGQKPQERAAAVQLLDPRSAPKGAAMVIGTPKTGSLGLNLSAAHTVVWMSEDYAYWVHAQADDRPHRPGQFYPVSYFRIIATGPAGQKTINHVTMKAVLDKEDVATWTTSAWRQALLQE